MSKDLIVILIISLFTLLAWVGFDIYQSRTQPTLAPVLQQQLQPLDPHLDFETVQQLKQRQMTR
ncbi:hypothetical protein L6258_01025 [Candidatus Parcubacteria bacterium]|nr:hypothetical protein [Candidatus Parcubacteria bacterium]